MCLERMLNRLESNVKDANDYGDNDINNKDTDLKNEKSLFNVSAVMGPDEIKTNIEKEVNFKNENTEPFNFDGDFHAGFENNGVKYKDKNENELMRGLGRHEGEGEGEGEGKGEVPAVVAGVECLEGKGATTDNEIDNFMMMVESLEHLDHSDSDGDSGCDDDDDDDADAKRDDCNNKGQIYGYVCLYLHTL